MDKCQLCLKNKSTNYIHIGELRGFYNQKVLSEKYYICSQCLNKIKKPLEKREGDPMMNIIQDCRRDKITVYIAELKRRKIELDKLRRGE